MVISINPTDRPIFDAEFEQLSDQLEKRSLAHNTSPDPEMGNLSPDQVAALLYTEWEEPESAIQFRAKLPLARCEEADFFRRARWLALAIQDEGGAKATAGLKNLPRKLVTRMVNEALDATDRDRIWQFSKVLNEEDVAPVHITRVVCQRAGLIRLHKGTFIVSKSKAKLLAPERAGELLTLLFITYFRKFNLAYLDYRQPEATGLQAEMAYTLCCLGRVAHEWHSMKDLLTELILPSIRDELAAECQKESYTQPGDLLRSRIIRPLIDWGLITTQPDDNDSRYFAAISEIRTTPLYRDFLQFNLP